MPSKSMQRDIGLVLLVLLVAAIGVILHRNEIILFVAGSLAFLGALAYGQGMIDKIGEADARVEHCFFPLYVLVVAGIGWFYFPG